jgi:Cys-rich four helix bundle protein (predicted Tat secretion target)
VAQNKKRMQQVHPPYSSPDLVAAPVESVVEDTSMTGCADTAFQLVAACSALAALAAVNSEHTGHLAKAVAMVCKDCQKECEKYPKVAECKACGESCKACAAECDKVAA